MPDLAIQYTEEVVGANHPTKPDTLNRAFIVEHSPIDGTHDDTIIATLSASQIFAGEKEFSGGVKYAKGTTIASAAAITIPADGSLFDVSGTANISSINTKGIGFKVILHFTGNLNIIHSANLVLPHGQNINVNVNSVLTFYEFAAGVWILLENNMSNIIYSEVALPALYSITANASWEDTGLQIVLANVGRYELKAVATGALTKSAASGQSFITGRLYNATDVAVIANSEFNIVRLDNLTNSIITTKQAGSLPFAYITTTSANTIIKFQALADAISGVLTQKDITSDVKGKTKISYVRLG